MGPPKVDEAAKPTSSVMTSRIFGAPLGNGFCSGKVFEAGPVDSAIGTLEKAEDTAISANATHPITNDRSHNRALYDLLDFVTSILQYTSPSLRSPPDIYNSPPAQQSESPSRLARRSAGLIPARARP